MSSPTYGLGRHARLDVAGDAVWRQAHGDAGSGHRIGGLAGEYAVENLVGGRSHSEEQSSGWRFAAAECGRGEGCLDLVEIQLALRGLVPLGEKALLRWLGNIHT